MRRLRVLHLTPDLVPYGLENLIAGLVRTLDPDAFESAIVSMYPEQEGGLEPQLRAEGFRLFHLGKKRGLDLSMYPRLARTIRKFRPHILHTHNYVLRYAYPVACWTRVPVVVHTIHNVADREVDRVGVALQRFAFRRGVAAVTIADEVSASFWRIYGYSETALIANAIDVERYATPAISPEQWRRKEGLAVDAFSYLCVARFSEQKDHQTLLKAFAKGPAQIANTVLWLAGDGELRAQTEQLACELGIGDQVNFLGRRADMPETLAAADAFVLGSRWEGNPLSVMEAMAAGKAVAATRAGAIPELVRDGVDGWLSATGDVDRLAQSMIRLRAPQIAASMGQAAALRAREKFGLPAMASAYAELYQKLWALEELAPPRMRGVRGELTQRVAKPTHGRVS